MRFELLSELHASHMGIVKIKMLARSYIWWPNIDKDIEGLVRSCKICLEEQKNPAHTLLTTWPYSEKAWYRLHCDFLGPLFDKMYLVIIGAYSKWPVVIDFNKNTKSSRLIEEFKKVFTDYGLPK